MPVKKFSRRDAPRALARDAARTSPSSATSTAGSRRWDRHARPSRRPCRGCASGSARPRAAPRRAAAAASARSGHASRSAWRTPAPMTMRVRLVRRSAAAPAMRMMSISSFRPGEPHVEHRHQRLPAGDDARLVAVLGERRERLVKRLGAEVVEAGGLHRRAPEAQQQCESEKPRSSRRRRRPGGRARSKNWRITILVAPSSSRPPMRGHFAADLGVVVVETVRAAIVGRRQA